MKTSADQLFEIFLNHPQISTNSRDVNPQGIFFALKGPNFDANRFADQALQNGCSFAVIDDPTYDTGPQTLLVDDVLTSLQNLARHYRQTLTCPVIGITGTNGKTSTKNLLLAILRQKFNPHATAGNLNNHIGVPLTILSCPPSCDILIVEMGANHPGEIAQLCSISQPNYGLITNVGLAHLEGFHDFETIVETKTALYRAVAQNQGLVFVPNNQPELLKHSEAQPRLTYGLAHADFLVEAIPNEGFAGIRYNGLTIVSHLVGAYNLYNLCAAACMGHHFGLTDGEIRDGICSFIPDNNRSQLVKTALHTLILDAYNANPTSMKAAIDSFVEMPATKHFFILGDMLELGPNSPLQHQEVIDYLLSKGLNEGLLVGAEFAACRTNPFETFATAEAALERTLHIPQSLILVKGSRGIHLEKLIPSFLQKTL